MTLYVIFKYMHRGLGILNTWLVRTEIKRFGKGSRYLLGSYVAGGGYIEVGENTIINKHVAITAQYVEGVTTGKPIIKIGDDCSIGTYNHITGINKIRIGNGLLTGPDVLITDNSHGGFVREQLKVNPRKRPLVSSGEVVIGNNVWIGEKASILPGVHIGDGCIIGANSVVTKDISPYSMAAGIPAKVIKQL